MKRIITKWWSQNLNKDMEIVAYGDYGFALLMFPTAAADYLEYERFQLIDSIAPFIDSGKGRHSVPYTRLIYYSKDLTYSTGLLL